MNEAYTAAALSDFDAFMEANNSLPHVHYSFRREKMPTRFYRYQFNPIPYHISIIDSISMHLKFIPIPL